jgi:hypothetical protein
MCIYCRIKWTRWTTATIKYPPLAAYAVMRLRDRGEHWDTWEELEEKLKPEVDAMAKEFQPYESQLDLHCSVKGCEEEPEWREVWPYIMDHSCDYHKQQYGDGRATAEEMHPLEQYYPEAYGGEVQLYWPIPLDLGVWDSTIPCSGGLIKRENCNVAAEWVMICYATQDYCTEHALKKGLPRRLLPVYN